jgi:hypothetical protein
MPSKALVWYSPEVTNALPLKILTRNKLFPTKRKETTKMRDREREGDIEREVVVYFCLIKVKR